MKLLKMLKYDIDEGIFKYWYKWIVLIFVCIITVAQGHDMVSQVEELYRKSASFFELGASTFLGIKPFDFSLNSIQKFVLPYEWIMVYVLLSFLVGGHVKGDMEHYGIHMMYKCKKRSTWWMSKFMWCIFVNLLYFGVLWGLHIAFTWVISGEISFSITKPIMQVVNGYLVGADWTARIIIVFVMPVLVGIVHSLIQIVTSIHIGEEPAMVLIGIIMVFSAYYSNALLPSGYSMSIRYASPLVGESFVPLDYEFGLVYLLLLIAVLFVAGLVSVKKKDIYW